MVYFLIIAVLMTRATVLVTADATVMDVVEVNLDATVSLNTDEYDYEYASDSFFDDGAINAMDDDNDAVVDEYDVVVPTSNIISSLSDELDYDDNNRLSKHALVYVDSPACREMDIGNLRHKHHDVYAVEGTARNEIFTEEEEEYCQAACIERGVDKSLVSHIMPNKIYDNNSDNVLEWFEESCNKVEVCFINYHDRVNPIRTYWVGFDGEPVLHFPELAYGEGGAQCFTTFMGHSFRVMDHEDNFLAAYEIEFVATKAFGSSPPSDSRDPNYSYEDEIAWTLNNEWTRHERVTRTFSPLGFQKGKLPPDVFANMGAFYYNNRNHVVLEEWGGKGVFVNWWETKVQFVMIPWTLKNRWQSQLLKLVEAWAGVPVEQTVMYGLRQYTEGARLLTHVDRHETHAVSLIVNVAQGNLAEPWPVEVQDHMDRLHEVIMEPGDIVYYESAKCLHARNRPMMGPNAHYVNLFTHYKPVTDLEWWHQPNHEGTPEPVLESDGECQLLTDKEGVKGFSVQCEDERLGPHLSPSLFQAHNGEDMIRWWLETSPNHERIEESNDRVTPKESQPESTPFIAIETPSRDEL